VGLAACPASSLMPCGCWQQQGLVGVGLVLGSCRTQAHRDAGAEEQQ
jgi:hypothetical protein